MKIETERLSLSPIGTEHAPFMFYLMNTPKWKEFIGDRKIKSMEEAKTYIQQILEKPHTNYWVIQNNETQQLIGILTFMKRDYLEYFDLGFALFPEFFGKGFAFEASSALLNCVTQDKSREKVLATTLPSNKDSIQLLKKLNFSFLKEIQPNKEVLHVYSSSNLD
jgi:RimJ/RimL family protein N-acetyltransferase